MRTKMLIVFEDTYNIKENNRIFFMRDKGEWKQLDYKRNPNIFIRLYPYLKITNKEWLIKEMGELGFTKYQIIK